MHKRTASNPNELKQCCKKEWAKTHPLWRERLINYTAKIYLKLMLLQMLLQAIEMWGVLSFHRTVKSFFHHMTVCWLNALHIIIPVPKLRVTVENLFLPPHFSQQPWTSRQWIPQQSEEEVMTQEGVISQQTVKPAADNPGFTSFSYFTTDTRNMFSILTRSDSGQVLQ